MHSHLISWRSRLVASLLIPIFAAIPMGGTCAEAPAAAEHSASSRDYVLGSGDLIKISVFQNPDLTIEARVSENGTITYPLIGEVAIGGMSTPLAERKIAKELKDGSFLVDPQVTILLEQIRGNQVAALGQFNRPGRFPLETTQMRLSDLLAQAGGITPTGADTVVFTGVRNGKTVRKPIDVGLLFTGHSGEQDFVLQPGDILYVDRAPMFYIYGEVQHPGSYRIERNMTFMQAVATAGGLTPRGSRSRFRVDRRAPDGKTVEVSPELTDRLLTDDVIYVREKLF